MVGTQILNLVNDRCCMVKYKNPEGKDFGNVNILAVGDLYQLTPVMQTELYKKSYKDVKCAVILLQIVGQVFTSRIDTDNATKRQNFC